MLTEKDYCDYKTCFALEEVGFPLHPYGNTEIDTSLRLTVLLYEAQKWLREEKDMNVYVKAFNGEGWYYIIQNYKGARIYPPLARIVILCHSYEEALLEGIKEAVKILKENENI